jgi:prepilin-type processing-associated H-X9-DG protein
MNNVRQIAQASLLYKADNNDTYPYGDRIDMGTVTKAYGWPMQLLRYMGGYKAGVQPGGFICPSVTDTPNTNYAFQEHYQANRQLLRDIYEEITPGVSVQVRGSQVRNPAMYWMFIEKAPWAVCNIRGNGLGNTLLSWNIPNGSPEYRRHNGGTTSAAADGHVEWLRTPPYRPGAAAPLNFLELGDCNEGVNPCSTWCLDEPDNGTRVKLWSRYSQGLNGQPLF